MEGSSLTFFVNGSKVIEPKPEVDASLLQYLRRKLLLTGTKEGCGHGGCGSCTIMLSRFDATSKRLLHWTVNACLFPLPAVHGLAVTTVEGVGSPSTGLHAIQKQLISSHGLQCGFCTPGFIMSAFTLLKNNPHPTKLQVERALEGNLCRCTGYRPILSALEPFTKDTCPMGNQCCKNRNQSENESPLTGESLCPAVKESTQIPIFPPELQLKTDSTSQTVRFAGERWEWLSPADLNALLELKGQYPDAPIIMGNTTAALDIKLGKFNHSPVLLYGASIPDLHNVKVTESEVTLGAAVTMTELEKELSRLTQTEIQRPYIQPLLDMVGKYGADQVRNVATVGGSLLCGRSNSDVRTILLALDATITVHNATTGRSRSTSLEAFALQSGEVLTSVTVPINPMKTYTSFYKASDRRSFSLAIINSGMVVRFTPSNQVQDLRLSFGGIRNQAVLMSKVSSLAQGKSWNRSLLDEIVESLTEEFTQDTVDTRDNYKASVATAFFFKFFSRIAAELSGTFVDDTPSLQPLESTLFYHPCTDVNQLPQDPVGRDVPHVSAEAIVSGEAIFIDDMPKMAGELFLSLVLSRKARARLVSVDPSDALKLPGVHGYIDHTDIPGENICDNEEVFATKEVFWVGQTIGAVLADTRETARQASYLVKVTYEELPAILTMQEAIKTGSYDGDVMLMVDGDVEEGFKNSDVIVEGEFSNGFQEHFYIEPQGSLAIPRIENKEIDVYCCTQILDIVQQSISKVVNVPHSKLTCKIRRLGGSFGGKESRCRLLAIPVTLAALKYKRPVRCVLAREVDMAITGKRHPFYSQYKLGCKKDGSIQAYQVKAYNNGGWSTDQSRNVMGIFLDNIEGAYRIPNVKIEGYVCKTNIPTNTSFRGFGAPQACQLVEEAIYNVAEALGMTAEQVREKNLYKEGDISPHRVVLENCTVRDLWKQCQEECHFDARLRDIITFNSENNNKKRGIAMTTMKFGVGPPCKEIAQSSALVNIYRDGSVMLTHGGVEMGQGLNTKMLQLASRVLGVPMDKLYTNETGTHTIPNAGPTGGSFGTDIHGLAVLDACSILVKRLQPLKDANPDLPWEQLTELAFQNRAKLTATGFSRMKLDVDFDREKKLGEPFRYYTYGVACAQVEIDVLTGEHQVLQADIMFDVGKSLNPAIDIGQIEGGFVQGLGMVTTEQMYLDQSGRMVNCSPLSYKIPTVASLPRKFKVTLLKNHKFQTTVYSSKGVGEPPLLLSVSVLMAIKEAVKAARVQVGLHGHFTLDSPATVQKIQEACGGQRAALQKIGFAV